MMLQKIKEQNIFLKLFLIVLLAGVIFKVFGLSPFFVVNKNSENNDKSSKSVLNSLISGCGEAYAQTNPNSSLVCHPYYAIASSSGDTINPFWASDGSGNQITSNLTWEVITTSLVNATPTIGIGATFRPKFMILSPRGRTTSTTVQVKVSRGDDSSICCVAISDGVRYKWGSAPSCICYKSIPGSSIWRDANPEECKMNIGPNPDSKCQSG
jgi:hypothetical protein